MKLKRTNISGIIYMTCPRTKPPLAHFLFNVFIWAAHDSKVARIW
jgi:hypothetical protein